MSVTQLERASETIKEARNQAVLTLVVDGQSLSIGSVSLIASGRDNVTTRLSDDENVQAAINASLQFLLARTTKSVYGVTTGFGGSASTRTDDVEALQLSILEHLLAGVHGMDATTVANSSLYVPPFYRAMPESIVRAATLIRMNTLARGHSGVRVDILHSLAFLLNAKLTPLVPLRGSISASGDLSPLGYVAGSICAHPDVHIIDRSFTPPRVIPCAQALAEHQIEPIILGPKEGLALVNGTAFSAAAAALALHDAHILALLSQVLTAMMAEAMLGQAGAFHPFIHHVARQHPGQTEVANNIYSLLADSKLVDHHDSSQSKDAKTEMAKQSLRQDRYAIRTAPQWIGPQLEDIVSAHDTVTRELNATTDNPLIDVENAMVHHAGNFQATSVANAMEKTRLALAALGKLAFAQVTELNNASQNKGLPSCLAGDEPSTNYHTKGLDTVSAGYCAELQHLAHPVTTHAQSAEQHNQTVNSMALVSARKTIEAAEVLRILMAGHLYCLCQALDLRALEIAFRAKLSKAVEAFTTEYFSAVIGSDHCWSLSEAILNKVIDRLEVTATMDSPARFSDAFTFSIPVIISHMSASGHAFPLSIVGQFVEKAAATSVNLIKTTRDEYFKDGTATPLLGRTRILYEFVRKKLSVKARRGDVAERKVGKSVGTAITTIFNAMSPEGDMAEVLVDMLVE